MEGTAPHCWGSVGRTQDESRNYSVPNVSGPASQTLVRNLSSAAAAVVAVVVVRVAAWLELLL